MTSQLPTFLVTVAVSDIWYTIHCTVKALLTTVTVDAHDTSPYGIHLTVFKINGSITEHNFYCTEYWVIKLIFLHHFTIQPLLIKCFQSNTLLKYYT